MVRRNQPVVRGAVQTARCADGAVTAYPLPDPPPPGAGDELVLLPPAGILGEFDKLVPLPPAGGGWEGGVSLRALRE